MPLAVKPPRRVGGKWVVAGASGTPYKVDLEDGDDMARQSKKLDCTPEELMEAVAAYLAGQIPEPLEDVSEEPPVTGFNADNSPGLPGLLMTSDTYSSLSAALVDASPRSKVHANLPACARRWSNFRWQDTDRLAALDVDVEPGEAGWTESDMPGILQAPGPRPRYAWITKSGGVRLIYGPCTRHGLTARQRAALASLLLDCCAHKDLQKVELFARTARPPEGNRVWTHDACDEYSVIDLRAYLLRTGGRESVSEGAIAQWLSDHGLQQGERAEHDRCPKNPSPRAYSDALQVMPEGVMCYSNSCGAGFMPWSQLIATDTVSDTPEEMVHAALEQVHWTHARLILEASRPRCGITNDSIRRAGYEALLRILHPDEDIASVWRRDLRFVRGDGGWLHASTLQPYDQIGPNSIAALPWVGGSGPRRDLALSNAPLDGYARIEPVLWLIDKPTWDGDRVCCPLPIETGETDFEFTLEQAWEQLREGLPGIPDEWLRLTHALTVAALLGQSAGHTPPQTIIQGPTGSGKGAAVQFVSGVLGRPAGHLNFKDVAEMERSLGESLERRCPQVFGDEIGKVRDWWALSGALLRASNYVGWRKLFVGNILTRTRTSIVLAGSTLPAGLMTMREFKRRAAFIVLPRIDPKRTAEWDGALAESLEVTELARLRDSAVGAGIANAYITSALRVYRAANADGLRKWPLLAETLGLTQMGEDEEAQELDHLVRVLYGIWMVGAADCFETRGGRSGWIRCWHEGRNNEAADALTGWIDPSDPEPVQKGKLNRLEVADVVAACGLPSDSQVTLRVVRRGARWRCRFHANKNDLSLDRALFPTPAATAAPRA